MFYCEAFKIGKSQIEETYPIIIIIAFINKNKIIDYLSQ